MMDSVRLDQVGPGRSVIGGRPLVGGHLSHRELGPGGRQVNGSDWGRGEEARRRQAGAERHNTAAPL